jgi:hypothetical protein
MNEFISKIWPHSHIGYMWLIHLFFFGHLSQIGLSVGPNSDGSEVVCLTC